MRRLTLFTCEKTRSPKGVKDELGYYSSQFNCIELNATFYRLFPVTTYEGWYAKVPEGFKFFPKLEQSISHFSG